MLLACKTKGQLRFSSPCSAISSAREGNCNRVSHCLRVRRGPASFSPGFAAPTVSRARKLLFPILTGTGGGRGRKGAAVTFSFSRRIIPWRHGAGHLLVARRRLVRVNGCARRVANFRRNPPIITGRNANLSNFFIIPPPSLFSRARDRVTGWLLPLHVALPFA